MNAGLTEWLKSGISATTLALCAALIADSSYVYSEEPTPPPAVEPEVEPVPAAEPKPADTKPTPAPVPTATESDRAKKLLEQEAVSDSKLRQECLAQSAQHYQTGKDLFSQFEYEDAQRELTLAVKLDRSNKEARDLLTRVNDVLNIRASRYKSAIVNLSDTKKVMAQDKLVELDNRIDWGKKFMQIAQTDPSLSLSDRIRKYEQALTAFEKARELIKYMDFEISVDEQSNEVIRLTREVQKAMKISEVNLKNVDAAEAHKMAQEQRESVRRAAERKLNMMVDQARTLHEIGSYDAALNMANRILEIDPTNVEANSIISVSRDSEHSSRKKVYDEEYIHQYALNREAADMRNIPYGDYLVYPSNWKEISQRQGETHKVKEEEGWKQDIRKKLSRKVSFEFVDTALEEAIAFLNTQSRANILLDPKAEAGKTPITLRVNDMELETALMWVLRAAELEYDLRAQAIFVTKKANLSSNVETEVYDIRDLTMTVADFPGPHIEIGTSATPVTDPFKINTPIPTLQGADLQTLIKDKLLPAEFADPTTSIEERDGKLVVVQRPEVHERIRQLLRSFRDSQTIQVLTQVRYIDVRDNFLEQIGVHFQGLDAALNDRGVPNAAVDPLRQPSNKGIFPSGGGPGSTSFPSDIQPSAAFQFADFKTTPPYHQDYGAPSSTPGPRPITLIRPRLDPNFPNGNLATNTSPGALPNAAAGLRRQWWDKAFGSPVLAQAIVQNFVRVNPLDSALGTSISNNAQQGLLFQFRFLQSTQANAILAAVRKDQTTDQLLAPKLMQFNNQRSHILVASQKSYIRDYDISGSAFDPQIGTFLTGVVLELRPTVSNDKRYITMDVRTGTAFELEPPDVVFITNSGDVNNGAVGRSSTNLRIELPNLELRSISTTVTLPDSGTMLLSGLISDRKIDAKSGIPFLSDLPFIGRIFSNNYKERVRRNLLVLINAHIVLFDEEEANRQ